jgi:hypothetical protein
MAERAPNAMVQAVLMDMARTWDRLAIQTAHEAHERMIITTDQMTFSFAAVGP